MTDESYSPVSPPLWLLVCSVTPCAAESHQCQQGHEQPIVYLRFALATEGRGVRWGRPAAQGGGIGGPSWLGGGGANSGLINQDSHTKISLSPGGRPEGGPWGIKNNLLAQATAAWQGAMDLEATLRHVGRHLRTTKSAEVP